jgi:hypothetical protein
MKHLKTYELFSFTTTEGSRYKEIENMIRDRLLDIEDKYFDIIIR